ncbi:MAG TPA: phosphatase PAP2 family protein [Acidimicrobiales bacterium]|nr:phosphatase PAP2 family protein [Acidimicrobiales bacterium]
MRPVASNPLRTGALVSGAGLVVLVACGLVARNGKVGSAEESVFRALNDLPGWLYRPLWVFQQFGNIVVAVLVMVAVAALLRHRRLALAAVLGVLAKLAMERAVKTAVERRRPGTSIGDIVTRGHVPLDGLSFVSGHAVITTAFAVALMGVLPPRWRALPWIVVALNGLARIYVGAHNPLDIVGGCGLGMVIGGALYAFVASELKVEGDG